MRYARVLVIGALVLVPAGVAAVQLAQVVDTAGCPSRLVPGSGPIQIKLFYENAAQLASLQPAVFQTYLTERTGRAFQIVGLEHTDELGFRLAAAADPLSRVVLVFLGYRSSFPRVETARGMVDALGFATPGTSCAYVSFVPQQPTVCRLGLGGVGVQPAYAYAAHEIGHLLGLNHTPFGIMGKGVFDLCRGDTFSDAQRATVQRWGS